MGICVPMASGVVQSDLELPRRTARDRGPLADLGSRSAVEAHLARAAAAVFAIKFDAQAGT